MSRMRHHAQSGATAKAPSLALPSAGPGLLLSHSTQAGMHQDLAVLEGSAIVDQAELAELVQQVVYPRTGRTNHIRQHHLSDVQYRSRAAFTLPDVREPQENSPQSLLDRSEELIDQCRFRLETMRYQVAREGAGEVRPIAQQPRHQASVDPDDFSILDDDGRCRAAQTARKAFFTAEIARPENCDETIFAILTRDGPVQSTRPDIEDRICRVALPEQGAPCGVSCMRELDTKLSQQRPGVRVTIRRSRTRCERMFTGSGGRRRFVLLVLDKRRCNARLRLGEASSKLSRQRLQASAGESFLPGWHGNLHDRDLNVGVTKGIREEAAHADGPAASRRAWTRPSGGDRKSRPPLSKPGRGDGLSWCAEAAPGARELDREGSTPRSGRTQSTAGPRPRRHDRCRQRRRDMPRRSSRHRTR